MEPKRVLKIVGILAVLAGLGFALSGCAGLPFGANLMVHSGESIQDVIDQASPGFIIYVPEGTYPGDVTVDKDGITLKGEGTPKIDGDLIVDADNVTVDGFEVTGVLETTAFTSFANLTLIDTLIYGQVFNITLSCDDVVNEGESIQTSINGAAGGETICVAPGTYNESVTVNKSLTLLGAKADVDPRGGAWTGGISTINPGAGNTGIKITAANVTVNGFEITGGKYGIYVTPSAGDVSNVAIKFNDLHNNSKYGCELIDLVEGATLSAVNVSMNYVHHNDRNGLKMVDVTV